MTQLQETITALQQRAGSWPKLGTLLQEHGYTHSWGHPHQYVVYGEGKMSAADIAAIASLEARYDAEDALKNLKALKPRRQTRYIRITPETKAALDELKEGTWDDTVMSLIQIQKLNAALLSVKHMNTTTAIDRLINEAERVYLALLDSSLEKGNYHALRRSIERAKEEQGDT